MHKAVKLQGSKVCKASKTIPTPFADVNSIEFRCLAGCSSLDLHNIDLNPSNGFMHSIKKVRACATLDYKYFKLRGTGTPQFF